MRIKKTFYLLFASILLLTGFSACNDDDPVELRLVLKTANLKLNEESTMYIYSGNGGYVVSVDNESIVSATVKDNRIILTPKSKGTTTLTLTDRENKVTSATLNVSDPYMAFFVIQRAVVVDATDKETVKTITEELNNSSSLLKAHVYDLSKTDSKTFNVYKENWFSTPVSAGTYTFAVGGEQTLSLKQGSSEHTYLFEENNTAAQIFYDYFTSEQSQSRTSPASLYFNLTEDLTAKYKMLYPAADIKKVTIVALVQSLYYKYE